MKQNGKPKQYRGPGLMGLAEIAARFNTSTQNVNQWRKASTFPAPCELACGRVWLEREIIAWAKRYRPELLREASDERKRVSAPRKRQAAKV